ncbi:hypothetical protein EMCRGX_G023543 [Ephydatia muelleri]
MADQQPGASAFQQNESRLIGQQPYQGGQAIVGPQGQQQTVMFGGQPVMAAGQQGGQMMMGQQGGQMMMGQPMMMGQQGGQMMMGQPMMMGQQGGQMATGQPMVMGQPMVVGQPMVMMGGQQAVGPWPAQMQVGPMGQLPQVQMAGVPMGQMAYPQMYPPPSAGVMYNSAQGGMVVMGSPYFNPPNLKYTPVSYLWLSYFTMVVFGLMFPLSLLLSVPAVVMSRKSVNSAGDGDIRKAKSNSTVAVYLNFAAVVFAFVAGDLVLGLVLGLYQPPRYY